MIESVFYDVPRAVHTLVDGLLLENLVNHKIGQLITSEVGLYVIYDYSPLPRQINSNILTPSFQK